MGRIAGREATRFRILWGRKAKIDKVGELDGLWLDSGRVDLR